MSGGPQVNRMATFLEVNFSPEWSPQGPPNLNEGGFLNWNSFGSGGSIHITRSDGKVLQIDTSNTGVAFQVQTRDNVIRWTANEEFGQALTGSSSDLGHVVALLFPLLEGLLQGNGRACALANDLPHKRSTWRSCGWSPLNRRSRNRTEKGTHAHLSRQVSWRITVSTLYCPSIDPSSPNTPSHFSATPCPIVGNKCP